MHTLTLHLRASRLVRATLLLLALLVVVVAGAAGLALAVGLTRFLASAPLPIGSFPSDILRFLNR